MYLQLFGREPDAGGKNFYLNKLESREMSLQTITLDVLNGSMGNDALIIENKIAIANYFTDKVGNSEFEYDESNIDDIALILLNIDDTTDSFSFATREIDSQFGSVGSSSGAVFYTSNNGQSLSYINFKTNQSKLISDSLPFNSSKIFFQLMVVTLPMKNNDLAVIICMLMIQFRATRYKYLLFQEIIIGRQRTIFSTAQARLDPT